MTAIRDLVELTVDQPPIWIALIVALAITMAVVVLGFLAIVGMAIWEELHAELSAPMEPTRTIADRQQIVDDAFAQVRR